MRGPEVDRPEPSRLPGQYVGSSTLPVAIDADRHWARLLLPGISFAEMWIVDTAVKLVECRGEIPALCYQQYLYRTTNRFQVEFELVSLPAWFLVSQYELLQSSLCGFLTEAKCNLAADRGSVRI